MSLVDPIDGSSCGVSVSVMDGLHILDICDVSQNMYAATTHGMNYLSASTVCDTSMEKRAVHKTVNVPSFVWDTLLDYDDVHSAPPLDSGLGDWVALNGPLFVKMVQSSFKGIVNTIRATHPHLAGSPWSFFVGGTRDTMDAFLGFDMGGATAHPASAKDDDLFFRLDGGEGGRAPVTFFAPLRMSVYAVTRIKAEITVRDDETVSLRIGVATSATEDRVFLKDIDGADGSRTKFMVERLGKIMRRSAMFHRAVTDNEDEFSRLFEGSDRIPLMARCYGCNTLCSRYGKCTGCYQAAYCPQCYGDASKVDPHVAMCEKGIWNAIVEIPVICQSHGCNNTCSIEHDINLYGSRCEGCNSFWCRSSACKKDHLDHAHACRCHPKVMVEV